MENLKVGLAVKCTTRVSAELGVRSGVVAAIHGNGWVTVRWFGTGITMWEQDHRVESFGKTITF